VKLRFKEDPKEWRKHAWLAALGVAVVCSVLRWRHVVSNQTWLIVLAAAAVVFLSAWAFLRLFRPYYRASTWLGFYLSMAGGRVALAIFFVLFLTPLGLMLRLMGKDLLRMKRRPNATSYWNLRSGKRSMDRLF
jgi:hypothetical protein